MAFDLELKDHQDLPDVRSFIGSINGAVRDGFFSADDDILIARAPGRLDIMGGIADYSGSLVLERPIAEATFAATQKNKDRFIRIVSMDRRSGRHARFEIGLDVFDRLASDEDYDSVRKHFTAVKHNAWAAYAAGAFFVLRKEIGAHFDTGANILIDSSIPSGKGVSSSAAIEVGVMSSICAAFDISIEARTLALLSQKVENHVVGAACGVMDQITSNCGIDGELLAITCQPAEIEGSISLPKGLGVWGIDSGVRHSVVGADYSSVRVGTFMGYRIIADICGFGVEKSRPGIVKIIDPKWNGYPANISPEEYVSEFQQSMPASMKGRDFLERYSGTTDIVAPIDPDRLYAVKAPIEHAIYESSRVRKFAATLKGEMTEAKKQELGTLMFASHESYRSCGLTETGTDMLVALAREHADRGVYGARITGGGSGGTVAFLAKRESENAIHEIAEKYAKASGRESTVFQGSSPGASQFGTIRLRPAFVRRSVG